MFLFAQPQLPQTSHNEHSWLHRHIHRHTDIHRQQQIDTDHADDTDTDANKTQTQTQTRTKTKTQTQRGLGVHPGVVLAPSSLLLGSARSSGPFLWVMGGLGVGSTWLGWEGSGGQAPPPEEGEERRSAKKGERKMN